jgi:hypothetical protein
MTKEVFSSGEHGIDVPLDIMRSRQCHGIATVRGKDIVAQRCRYVTATNCERRKTRARLHLGLHVGVMEGTAMRCSNLIAE